MMTSRPDIFLSYSREDQAVARRFADGLQREGFQVWWDQTLGAGQAYDEVTEAALEGARAVVVLWSRTSVSSRWVRAEATTADRNKVLVPVMIEPCKRPVMFELTQTAELGHWKGNADDPAWRAFVADLGRFIPRESPAGASPVPVEGAVQWHRTLAWTLGVALMAAVAAGGWFWHREAQLQQARESVAAIAELVDLGKVMEAFSRLQQVRTLIPDDPQLKSLVPFVMQTYSVTSKPAGAEVYVRVYDAPDTEWKHLGRTPLERVEMPLRALHWRFEKEGFVTTERANSAFAYQPSPASLARRNAGFEVELQPAAGFPPEMVYVPEGKSLGATGQGGTGFFAEKDVPAFLIDRYEVTNAEYKEFIDAGGYERASLWEGLDIRKEGRPLLLEQARHLFVDSYGRPGPATWELGTYPAGQGRFPVAGISWYEAMAYARFRGKSLPSLYHWLRAARHTVRFSSLAASAAQFSNFSATAPAAVGQFRGAGPFGSYDLFGNVREWLLNPGKAGGWVIGGSWEDSWYQYMNGVSQSLIERSRLNGFRLMKNIVASATPADLVGAVDIRTRSTRDISHLKPVSNEVYATLVRQFTYTPGPLDVSVPVTMATTEDWIKQRVTINAGYGGERMDVILFVPHNARPPFQPIVFISGGSIVDAPATLESIEPGLGAMRLDYIVKSGRVLVQPIFKGSYNRFSAPMDLNDPARLMREFVNWRWDLGRTIDYLASRPDMDASRIGYVGISLGAAYATPLLAVEPRLKAAVLYSGGLAARDVPLIEAINYLPRIRIPVLMINGRLDEVFPLEAQEAQFRLLGTAPSEKRYRLLDGGHVSLPRPAMLRETLDWYDKYLGEVRR